MKKPISILLALALALSLCVPAFAAQSHTIASKAFPLYVSGEDTGETRTLYFLDGVTDLPYMEARDLCDLLTEAFGPTTVTFTMDVQDSVVTMTRHHEGGIDDGCTATFDFARSEICFYDYDVFTMRDKASGILDVTTMSFFDDEGRPALIQKVDKGTFARYGDALTLPLANYGIELIYQPIEGGLYLIPLQTINDFFLAPPLGAQYYYNGQTLNLTDAISSGNALYYAAPTGERSAALTKYGYGELCMMLDYLYGLKAVHDIDSFAQLFHEVGFDAHLTGPEVRQADAAILRLITDYFDDGHSAWHGFSYLTGDLDYKPPVGTSRSRLLEQRALYKGAREKFYPDGVPGYEEIGNTAYITFDGFDRGEDFGSAEDFYNVENPADFSDDNTIGLIMKAHAMITRENSPIENVVIDLSANGGGEVDTAIFVIAWFLGEANIGMKDTMTGAVSASNYRCDANRDRVFDERDTVADKNLFVLTSPYSFSCGNLVPCAFKESGKVTVMGRTSGGGSCVVLSTSSAWGTSFQISGNRRISFIKNGSYYDVDRGAEPDIVITSPEMFYDRAALAEYINGLYGVKKTAVAANTESSVLPDAAEDGAPTIDDPQAEINFGYSYGPYKKAESHPVA